VTNSALATAIRLSLFKKGLDPSDFALVSFGGAGGLHACEVADAMGIGEVIFPAHAGTLSAYGILWSDVVHDLAAACVGRLDEAGAGLAPTADALMREGETLLAEDGVPPAARRLEWALDLRYRGQAFELTVPLAEAAFDDAGLARAAAAFHHLHRRRFAFDEPTTPVEVVNLRLRARGLTAESGGTSGPTNAPHNTGGLVEDGAVEIVVHGARRTVPVRYRGAITTAMAGPLIVTEAFTTLFIPPGWRVAATPAGHLRATREG
jgi:N-methylhydantoinase A